MTFHCDNPTCAAYVVLPLGSLMTRGELEAALSHFGWRLVDNGADGAVVCPRCIQDLVHA